MPAPCAPAVPGRRRWLPAAVLGLCGWLSSGDGIGRTPPPAADVRIEVFKSARELRVYSGDALRRTYRIGLGGNPVPPKRRQGDRATPEGLYYVSHKNPRSQFYLSLGVGYPNADDAERGLRDRRITKAERDRIVRAFEARRPPPSNTALGGDIFVHGRGSGSDWTWGCIALDDADMKALYDSVDAGTPIAIHP